MAVFEPTSSNLVALADDRGMAPRGVFSVTWRFLRRQPVGAIGIVVVLVFGLSGILAEFMAPYNPTANDFAAMTEAPSTRPLMPPINAEVSPTM
jgi:peptide/nickel transport system permease protein